MIDKDIATALIGAVCFISVTTVLPVSIMRLRHEKKGDRKQQLPVGDIIARLERMEVGMESMSAEIERIGEGQRFTTRLLNERDPRLLENMDDAKRRS